MFVTFLSLVSYGIDYTKTYVQVSKWIEVHLNYEIMVTLLTHRSPLFYEISCGHLGWALFCFR